jgi:hypothetical protein
LRCALTLAVVFICVRLRSSAANLVLVSWSFEK